MNSPAAWKSSGELLAEILPRWRGALPPRLQARDIDGFLRRKAGAIEAAVQSAVTLRRMLDGAVPDTTADFAAYAEIVAHERPLDAQPDADVVKRMARRIDRLLAQGESAAFALREQGREFVDARAEALLLRHNHGWDAVALYLTREFIRDNRLRGGGMPGALPWFRRGKDRIATRDLRHPRADQRLRAKGITGVIHETITETTADGDTLTIHHLRAKRG